MSRLLIVLFLFFCVAPAVGATNVDKFHGNYCGTLSGDISFSLRPIDALDRACMAHDKCYTVQRGACACDRDLRVTAYEIKKDAAFSKDLRKKAGRVVFAMLLKPCGS